ncbi:MAG: alkaline phosphatase family protein [Candidatus Omnitrophota bacterium]
MNSEKKISRSKSFLIPCLMLLILFVTLNTGTFCRDASDTPRDIRLVVMIVIDQLRADMISRMEKQFDKNGFRYLTENGVRYQNAHYDYANTITAVGHASLFTGTASSNHGIIGNSWFDQNSGKEVNAVVIPSNPQNPQEKIRGPFHLLSTTIGDELVLSSNKQSRVFGISSKDRGAILPSGFLGKAFWFDNETGQFTTSTYYYPSARPSWLTHWNAEKHAESYRNKSWNLLKDKSTYIYGPRYAIDNEAIKAKLPNVAPRSSFPHAYDPKMLPYKEMSFYEWLQNTPFGDEMTIQLACRLLKEEKLGQGSFPDMLTVSLSGTDAIGHTYGPDSLEYEDNILHVDQCLAELFQAVNGSVGLDHTLIVVTADHGGDYTPETRDFIDIIGGRLNPKTFAEAIDSTLQKKYKTSEAFVLGFRNPSLYLNMRTIDALNLNIEEVEHLAADALKKIKGVALAMTRSDLLKGHVPGIPLMEPMKKMFHPKRSGNILIVQEPFWYLYHDINDAAMHGSPYNYDTHVPLFFSGPGIKPRSVFRNVNPLDIAGTVALKLGIEAPPYASKNALIEIFE